MYIQQIKILLFLLLFPAIAFGQTKNGIDPTINDLSIEYTECAAFFSVANHAATQQGDQPLAERLIELQTASIDIATELTYRGRDVEETEKVLRSRIRIFCRDMKKQIGNDLANLSTLVDEHMDSCVEALHHPDVWQITD